MYDGEIQGESTSCKCRLYCEECWGELCEGQDMPSDGNHSPICPVCKQEVSPPTWQEL